MIAKNIKMDKCRQKTCISDVYSMLREGQERKLEPVLKTLVMDRIFLTYRYMIFQHQ